MTKGKEPNSKYFGKSDPGPINKDIQTSKQHQFREIPKELEAEYGYLN